MSKKVIDALNAARSREISAILQYMAQHYEMEDQGYGKLADVLKKTGIQEMKHAEAFAIRIIFLGGEPTSKPDTLPKKGQDILAIAETDMALEEQAMKMYNDAIKVCTQEGDNVTRELFERILREEDDHFNLFENIRDHVKSMGAAYIATLVGDEG